MDCLKDFSTALAQARLRKGVTQEEVAWSLSLSHPTYNAWECGHRICPYKHVISLINYFDDDVFTRKMIRILLVMQHRMAGLDKMAKTDAEKYYSRVIRLLSEEYQSWISEK